jgi:hypothetical protein
MSVTLHVDGERWRSHLRATLDAMPGLVPVVKGNGYGFGARRLAHEAAALGVDTVAVGEPEELRTVGSAFTGDVLVLAPWRPEWKDAYDDGNPRLIRTVSHLDALQALAGSGARVVVECLTSMRRHGMPAVDVDGIGPLLEGVRCEGFALHLPIDRPKGTSDVAEVAGWVLRLLSDGHPTRTIWVSHVTRAELAELADRFPDVAFRPRVGTALWLGDRDAYRARATVLDVRTLAPGDRFGYRQRQAPRGGTLLVVSGGTTHGIGLEAPKAARSTTVRAKGLARAGLEAAGRSLSPFTIGGRQRWYAEPPHMQVAMLLLPPDTPAPAIGDEVDVEVRMTTTRFDVVDGL